MSLCALTHATTRLPFIRFGRCCFSTLSSGRKLDPKAFSKTLLLPKTSFPLWPDPSKTEVPFRKKTCDDLYRWQVRHARGPLFVLHDGPPYANGHLHIGHALNKILKDIINRYHVSIGDRVHYVPGWDCHGLPIENKALQDLKGDPHTLAPDTIRSAARETAEREMSTQQEEFKQFGIMADWSPESTYRTLDHVYEIRQLRVFQQMVSKGLIYRHYRPVYYSPSSRSALAEAELVYKDDHVSHAVHVSFTVDAMDNPSSLAERLAPSDAREEVMEELQRGMVKLLVWTTTPWTLTANMGIAVHPDLTYVVARSQRRPGLLVLAKDRLSALEHILGSHSEIKVISEIPGTQLVGLRYRGLFSSPSTSDAVSAYSNSGSSHRLLQVISAAHVTPDTGTGLVHCAPAHGTEDYQAFRSQGLLDSGLLCHVDRDGKFSGNVRDVMSGIEGSGDLVGLEVLKSGSKAIVALLERTGSLLSVERFRHRYPYDWKTDEPVIVTATSQWFANLDNIKEDALTALENVAFFPPGSQNRLTSFVRSRSEWCISRQRVWGVPIPALHHIPSGAAILTASSLTHILDILDRKGVGYWWDGPVSEFVNSELAAQYGGEVSERTWRKSTDTMDVWFDSGTSWAMLPFGEEHGRTHRADVCLEGSDQHRGWFQSQLLTAVGVSNASGKKATSPYGTLITHGMVLDESGRKMSKSLGNVISPLTVINGGLHKKKEPAYGTDVLRLWAATVEYWRDMSIGPTVLAQTAESMRKIRNSARFILGNIGATKQKMKDHGQGNLPPVAKESLGLAERYVMNELYKLEQSALQGYATYNFPRVMTALVNFANITLSSLYFDITKDVLYANDVCSFERRAVVDTLERILRTMTSVLAPVLPHLAEEIHDQYADNAQLSFFTQKWSPLSAEWSDCLAEKDMESLLGVRSVVLALLERARGDKNLKSALEAKVTIALPSDTNTELVGLLKREEAFLNTLFIVSDVELLDASSRGPTSAVWSYTETMKVPGSPDAEITILVTPATLSKCPRCWTYTRPEHKELCSRCQDVVKL
ncbi:tRNA synthetases class I-domain-containing protein [Pisolithus croceorrhizus]|nr:tRNA synthetases class I-domain-containing protein [Pisolithus croceorrhizus]